MPRPAFRPLLPWAAFGAFLLTSAYWPGLSGAFIFDDYPNIVSRDLIHLSSLSLPELWKAAFSYNPDGGLPRPLATATFALNHVVGGVDPAGYKSTNLAIHLINSALIWALFARIIQLAGINPGTASRTAAVIALLWALHPLQVSTVLYVVQRMEMLCLTFILASLLCYLRARQQQMTGIGHGWGPLCAAAFFSLLAVASKEAGALAAVYGLAIECLLLRWQARSPAWERAWRVASLVGLVAIAGAFAWVMIEMFSSPHAYAMRDFGPAERLLAQLELLPLYLGQILLPLPDSMLFYYDHLEPPSRLTWAAASGATLLVALVATMLIAAKRLSLLSLGIAIFLSSHLITSSALPLELAFEHRNYFAVAGVLLGLAGLLLPLGQHLNTRLTWSVVAAVILFFGAMTMIRTSYWGNPYRLAAYLVEINPASTRASMDLGEQYMLAAKRDPRSPYYQRALDEFERASRLPQGSVMGEHGLLMMTANFNVPAQQNWWESMRQKLATSTIRPQDVDAVVGMVEHRNQGVELDDTQLAMTTLTTARMSSLAPELLFLFAQQALLASDGGAMAEELYARGLIGADASDPAYGARARHGITEIAGPEFLLRVEGKVIELTGAPHDINN